MNFTIWQLFFSIICNTFATQICFRPAAVQAAARQGAGCRMHPVPIQEVQQADRQIRPDGGIGRRVGLKHQCPKGCAGSTPAPGTMKRVKYWIINYLTLFVFGIVPKLFPYIL